MTMLRWFAFVLVTLAMPFVPATANEVFPSLHSKNMPATSEAPVASRDADMLTIKYNISCWGPNGRSVSGPVHDQNCLKLTSVIRKDGNPLPPFQLVFPAMLMDPTRAKPQVPNPACPAPGLVNAPSGWTMEFSNPQRKAVSATVHTKVTASTSFEIDGQREINNLNVKLDSIHLTQNGMQRLAGGVWGMGQDGYVSYGQSISPAPDSNSVIYVGLWFPGSIQAGQRAGAQYRTYCDAFYSPLMLFFDDKWPEFSGFTSFAVLPGSAWFVWPEAGAPGYFLALDRNKNGLIDDGSELFGEDQPNGVPNGFEKLRKLDADKNGKIDQGDAQFTDLLLWNDANGNGVSEPDELQPIGKKSVMEISLAYKKNQVYPVGGGAELRENAPFTYRNAKGHPAKGEVYDVWLSPTTPPTRAAASVGK